MRCVSCGAVNDIRGHWLLLIYCTLRRATHHRFIPSVLHTASYLCSHKKALIRIKFVLSKDAAAAVRPEYIAAARLLIFIAVRPEFAGSTPVHSSSRVWDE